MGLLEFLFPEQAQAIQLKRIADQQSAATYDADSVRDRLRREWQEKHGGGGSQPGDRLAILEKECATANLVIEALLEELEARGGITREALTKRMQEIDARDGVIDGRIGNAKTQ